MVVLFSVLSIKEQGCDEDTVSCKPRIREAKPSETGYECKRQIELTRQRRKTDE